MKKAVLLSIFLTLLLLTINSFAATYISINNGPWTSGSTWSLGVAPNANDIITIQHAVTLAGGTYNGTGSLTIQNGGSLTVSGNLTVTGGSTKGTVGLNGSLIVTGTLTLDNGAKLTMAGGSLQSGDLTISGGNYSASSGSVASVDALLVGNSGTTAFTNGLGATMNTSGAATFAHDGTNNGILNIGTSAVPADLTVDSNGSGKLTSNSQVTVYGNAVITGIVQLDPSDSAIASAIKRYSLFTVKKNLTVSGGANFYVGNNATTPPPYANAFVEGNVSMTGGNVTVNKNGRMVIGGDLNLNGGGIGFTIAQGGQVYVDGDNPANSDINVGAGGNNVTNNNANITYAGNPSTPFGLYVNNGVSATSGGSSISAKRGDEVLMQNSNPKFYDFVAGLTNSPLPVVLAYFRIQGTSDSEISLAWQTTMERNFDRFELERAGEDLQFSIIATVKGKGGLTTSSKYSFDDNQPLAGKNYYRLKMIDHDNYTDYSGVIVEYWSGTAKGISLYPNPTVNHTFTIELDDNYATPVHIAVVESRGYIVYTAAVETTSSVISLPANLVDGIYLVRISSAKHQQTVRLVVN